MRMSSGESQANRRYLYFAKQADVEGRPDIAGLFRDTAEGETGHAHGHLEYLEQVGDSLPPGGAIGDSEKNLAAAGRGRDLRVHADVPRIRAAGARRRLHRDRRVVRDARQGGDSRTPAASPRDCSRSRASSRLEASPRRSAGLVQDPHGMAYDNPRFWDSGHARLGGAPGLRNLQRVQAVLQPVPVLRRPLQADRRARSAPRRGRGQAPRGRMVEEHEAKKRFDAGRGAHREPGVAPRGRRQGARWSSSATSASSASPSAVRPAARVRGRFPPPHAAGQDGAGKQDGMRSASGSSERPTRWAP